MRRLHLPLWSRVLLGVTVGVGLGVAFGRDPWLGSFGPQWLSQFGNPDLGMLGMTVIRALKALATPLVLFAILDAFLATSISARSGLRLLAVCLVNVSVAMTLGLSILSFAHPGAGWTGHLEALGAAVGAAAKAPAQVEASLSPLQNFANFVPESLVDPFAKNLVISVVLFGILLGAALRSVRNRAEGPAVAGMATVEGLIAVGYAVSSTMLLWVAELMPFAAAGIVADVVGKAGIGVFSVLWPFFVTILAGLLLHALGWYPLLAWAVGGVSPARLFRGGLDAIVTAVSCNSSLATMPVTLRCLRGLGVSDNAARLSACVGTNFNNDGIMLYEAMATLFLCQAIGIDLTVSQQLTVVLASVMAGVGIAGIPEAGLIILPLVLSAAGVSDAAIALAVPLIVPVDWILARVRSGVNVTADMVVAIVLDRFEPRGPVAGPDAAAGGPPELVSG
ncbi:MAG: dicarboxylate/amino acid:cation symporter [Myxococcota bacterium]